MSEKRFRALFKSLKFWTISVFLILLGRTVGFFEGTKTTPIDWSLCFFVGVGAMSTVRNFLSGLAAQEARHSRANKREVQLARAPDAKRIVLEGVSRQDADSIKALLSAVRAKRDAKRPEALQEETEKERLDTEHQREEKRDRERQQKEEPDRVEAEQLEKERIKTEEQVWDNEPHGAEDLFISWEEFQKWGEGPVFNRASELEGRVVFRRPEANDSKITFREIFN